jgi:hypothetical protein
MDRAIDLDDRLARQPLEPAKHDHDRPAIEDGPFPRMLSLERERSCLSSHKLQILADLGRFRAIENTDLAQSRCGGNSTRLQKELRDLLVQNLVQRKTVWTGGHREKETFWTLTQEGKRLLKRHGELPTRQALYAGFVKPAELRHDAAIYPMYQKEAERLKKEGARIGRVVLDFELKKKVYSPLAKAKSSSPSEYVKRQAEIAQDHGLKVVNGHIVLPDLRIEYETADGQAEHLDLELATSSYHGSHASEKAAAGFRMYALSDTASRLSRVLDERGLLAEIFSL